MTSVPALLARRRVLPSDDSATQALQCQSPARCPIAGMVGKRHDQRPGLAGGHTRFAS